MSSAERKPTVTVEHPVPKLETLELETGDQVMYDPDTPEAFIQTDESHLIELDGRWR